MPGLMAIRQEFAKGAAAEKAHASTGSLHMDDPDPPC